MRAAFTLLALIAFGAKPAVVAGAGAPASVAEADELAQLVDLVVPRDTIIAATRAAWGDELAGRFEGDDRAIALDAARPGLRAAYIASGLDEVTNTYRATLDTLRADAMRVYGETLTPGEVAELLTFFRTPTGSKLVAAMQAGMAASDGLSAEALREDGRAAAMGALDDSDRPALEAFSRTAVFAKARTVSALIAKISGRAIAQNTQVLGMSVPAATSRTVARWANGEGGGQ